ncbi:MAG: hypothetical protein PHO06_00900 [Clostridia bacterium]|jgi:hypothetical protein|nr:hypothetical protein [Clostridia bacterium]
MNEKANSLTIEKQDLQEELKKLKMAQVITRTKEDVKNILGLYLNGDETISTIKERL